MSDFRRQILNSGANLVAFSVLRRNSAVRFTSHVSARITAVWPELRRVEKKMIDSTSRIPARAILRGSGEGMLSHRTTSLSAM